MKKKPPDDERSIQEHEEEGCEALEVEVVASDEETAPACAIPEVRARQREGPAEAAACLLGTAAVSGEALAAHVRADEVISRTMGNQQLSDSKQNQTSTAIF